jgi:hypothetical protein
MFVAINNLKMKKTITLLFLIIQLISYPIYADDADTISPKEEAIVVDPNDSANIAEQSQAVQEALSKSRDNIEQMKAEREEEENGRKYRKMFGRIAMYGVAGIGLLIVYLRKKRKTKSE